MTTKSSNITKLDRTHLHRAVELALEAEKNGNLPIGAVITLDDSIIAEGQNSMIMPHYHPGRHAEIEALRSVPVDLWPRAQGMTCYTTLEPCAMCTGTLLLHGVGRVVFGAHDRIGGGGCLLHHLPEFFVNGAGIVPEWIGPVLPEVCDELYDRAIELFETSPYGKGQ